MHSEWKRKTTVQGGGRVELVLPELCGDETVEVTVRREGGNGTNVKRPGYGAARGRVVIRDDFDAPLPDFVSYK